MPSVVRRNVRSLMAPSTATAVATRRTTCYQCTVECGSTAKIDGNGRIIELVGPERRRGAAQLDLQYHEERLLHPLKRTPTGLERISWDAAVVPCPPKFTLTVMTGGSSSADVSSLLTWLIVLGRTQPKQITEVDRVTASEPVEVEPTRDANRVFSVERPASPHATPSQPRQKANTGRRRVTHCTRHLPDDGRPPGFQPLQKVEQPDGLPGAIALR